MAKIPKKIIYRNYLDAILGVLPKDLSTFDNKAHSRTRPESKRKRRKTAHESRRRNRGR